MLRKYHENPTLVRAAWCGAIGILVAGPVAGILICVVMWLVTLELFYICAALVLLIATASMGAVGGVAYHLVCKYARIQNWFVRAVLAALAFMEAYLASASLVFWLLAIFVPGLFTELKADEPMFHILLHAYGVGLVLLVSTLIGAIVYFSADRPPPKNAR